MILSQEELNLSEHQLKLIKSGWGSEVIDNTDIKKIVYESDGVKVQGFLAYPKEISKKYPLIIWNRGGYQKDGRIDDFLAKGIYGEIASWGYVVLASQYREKDEYGGKDVNDILNLISLADEIFFCDTKKMGMEGWSRGGMMAYRVLSNTNKIICAVIISGLADLLRSEKNKSDLTEVYKKLFGSENDQEFKRRSEKRSAVYFSDKISKDTKILLIHGTADKKVSYKDSVDMYKKLQSNGIYTELKLIEDGDHYLRKHRRQLVRIRREWFNKYLKS